MKKRLHRLAGLVVSADEGKVHVRAHGTEVGGGVARAPRAALRPRSLNYGYRTFTLRPAARLILQLCLRPKPFTKSDQAKSVEGISRHELAPPVVDHGLRLRSQIHQNRPAADPIAGFDIIEDVSNQPGNV